MKTTAPKIGLAPMEGVLDPLMRRIITAKAQVDFCSTEFVRVTDKVLPEHMFFRYAPELSNKSRTESGTPVLVQILGGKPEWMAKNAKRALDAGAYGIDVNFGCPAKTVNRHDGGASLLKDPTRLYDCISTIKNEVGKDAHVSAKVRLGFSDKSLIKEIAIACSEAQASWITIHARTKMESYRPPAHWHCIREMKEVSTIPVFANGDIWNLEAYKKCQIESGCDDVMIGRGLLRNPFLAQEIKENAELDQNFKNQELLKMMSEYLEIGVSVYGEHAALGRIKQWLKMAFYPENVFFENLFLKVKNKKCQIEARLLFEKAL
jgi:tRNA-dihydrouridine synthase C